MCGLVDWPQPPEEHDGPGWYDLTVTVHLRAFLNTTDIDNRDIVDAVLDAVKDLDFDIEYLEYRDDITPEDIYDC